MALETIDAIPMLPPRPRDSHKGRFGTVLVMAGCRGMAGAAALCGASALRSGAGLVRVATPGRGPADRRQLRALLHDLSPTLRRRRLDPARARTAGAGTPDRTRPTSSRSGRGSASPMTFDSSCDS